MATLNNTIVAGQTSGGDIRNYRATITGSHNLIGDGSGGLADSIIGDPMLAPLADNGGPTQTMALLPGSPAIDTGSNALAVDANGVALAYDQRRPTDYRAGRSDQRHRGYRRLRVARSIATTTAVARFARGGWSTARV